MKRLRLFGLLATVLVLAFGLALGCDNGTTETDNTEAVTTTFFDAAQNISITFSNKAIEARARAAGPNDGDYYQIKRGTALLSSGTIQLQGNGTTIKFIEDSGATFTGQFLNNLLTINDTVGGQALNVSASTPGTSGGGSPSGPSGGGESPSGGGGSSGTAAKMAPWAVTFNNVTDQGFTVSLANVAPPNIGNQVPEYAAGLSDRTSPSTAWQKAPDFNGLQPGKEYAVWARAAAVAAADSVDGKAYAAGEATKGTALKTTDEKGLTGAAIPSPFVVVGTSTESTINLTNPAVVTNNPGSQPVEYAVSKTTTAPTSGWLDWDTVKTGATGFTGLDSGMDYNVFARTAYTASPPAPAYSAGAPLKGDKPITTLLKPGANVTSPTAQASALAVISAAAPSGTPEAGGELYIRGNPYPTTDTGQDIEYTVSTELTIGNINADTVTWWTVGDPAVTSFKSGDKVGISTSISLAKDGEDGLVFKGLLGATASTTATYQVYARSKAGNGYLAGTTITQIGVNAGQEVLIPAPAIVTYTVVASAQNTGGATATINDKKHDVEANSLTNPWISTTVPDFEYALYSAATGGTVLRDWAALTMPTTAGDPIVITLTGLETGTSYYLGIRVKAGAVFAQSTEARVVRSSVALTPAAGAATATTNTVAWTVAAAPTGANLKGQQFTITGLGVVNDAVPAPVTGAPVDYYVTTASGAQTSTTNMIKGTPTPATTPTGVLFTGLAENTTYYLWARPGADGTDLAGALAAATTTTSVTTLKPAEYPDAALAALPLEKADGGIKIGNATTAIAAGVNGQDWQFTTTTTTANPATTAVWKDVGGTITATNRTLTIDGLTPGVGYYVWVRSKEVPGEFSAGDPKMRPTRGTTLDLGADAATVAAWITANIKSAVIAGDTSSNTVTITFADGVTTLPPLPNQQEVEFSVSSLTAGVWSTPTNWYTTITSTAPNTDLNALIGSTAGTYRVVARAKLDTGFATGPIVDVSVAKVIAP